MKTGSVFKVLIFFLFVFVAIASVPFALSFKSHLPFSNGLHGHSVERHISDFTLMGANGDRITLQTHKGKFRLIFFGYTRCSTACPAALHTFKQLDRILASEKGKIEPIYYFITVDPVFDQPDRLLNFFQNFPSHYIGLTGNEEQIKEVQNIFQIPVAFQPDHHATSLFVIDPDNMLSLVYMDIPEAVRIKDDIIKIQSTADKDSEKRNLDLCTGR